MAEIETPTTGSHYAASLERTADFLEHSAASNPGIYDIQQYAITPGDKGRQQISLHMKLATTEQSLPAPTALETIHVGEAYDMAAGYHFTRREQDWDEYYQDRMRRVVEATRYFAGILRPFPLAIARITATNYGTGAIPLVEARYPLGDEDREYAREVLQSYLATVVARHDIKMEGLYETFGQPPSEHRVDLLVG